ncbi:hypothetical protein O181_082052 [Austropuccinia psidii MF-1]|uniref:Uncharacterized protein n=1 Tax=Austropuccinia psidii MF-1 TaxID=1389203 RepID=A0A9Q3IIV7_9BASI|nr:hypothetical protein [Austropuccinia psidii MF-1]
MLKHPHRHLDVTLTQPPISALITPYTSTPPPLTIHMLPQFPQDIPPMPPSTLLIPSPTRLILFAIYHPYTLAVSSRHASAAAHQSPPSSLLMLPHPRHSQSIRYRGALKIYLLMTPPLQQLPSLHSCSFLLTCLRCFSHTGLILNSTYHPYASETLSR